jgi:SPP1 family predicted phage head-tail adaptor
LTAAGPLRDRISLQSITWNRNQYGEAVAVPATYATVWAEIKDLSGRELYQAQQVNAEVTINVRIRRGTDVSQRHRIIFVDSGRTRTLEILAVLSPDNLKTEQHLLCVESPDGNG